MCKLHGEIHCILSRESKREIEIHLLTVFSLKLHITALCFTLGEDNSTSNALMEHTSIGKRNLWSGGMGT